MTPASFPYRLPHLMFLSLWALLLSACDGSSHDSSYAERAGIEAVGQRAGATPFVAQLDHTLRDFSHLDSIRFSIAPRPGTFSRPVVVTYDRTWLERRAAWDGARQHIAFPVFGLYAGHANEVTLGARFRDGSAHVTRLTVTTAPYAGAAAVYTTLDVRSARSGAWPGFDFMLVRNRLTGPVILDTDGQLRWVGAALTDSLSATFGGDAFYVGDPQAPRLYRLNVDGAVQAATLNDARYTRFHHQLAPGKTGLLAEVDAFENGVALIESIVAEVDGSGRVLKEWNLGQILRAAMRAGGDDPALFVRDGVDWFHMNSAIYDRRDDALLVSSRENFVVKLDYESGRILWLLGDTSKHWYVNFPSLRALALDVTSGKPPIGQHALSVLPNGDLLMFNNGFASLNQPPGTPPGVDRGYSTPSRYAIDARTRSAREVWTWDADRTRWSDVCSSAYEGAPGRYLVGYAALEGRTQARLSAVDSDGRLAFDYAYPTVGCDTMFLAQPFRLDNLLLR